MANMLSQFLIGGGNPFPLSAADEIPDAGEARRIARAPVRLGPGLPFGMTAAQFNLFRPRYEEFRRRMTGRPGQERAVLAEMGFTGAGNQPPPTQPPGPPTTRTVQTLPIGSDGTATTPPPPETGGGPGAASALNEWANAFRTPPSTTNPPPTIEPPPTTTADPTRGIGPWTTTVTPEPSGLWADIGRGLRNYGNSESGPDSRVNPISMGLLAGLGPPAPPPQTGWLSNPFEQRRPRTMPRFSGMFG